MSKKVLVMPSLEVLVERLPKAVIDAVLEPTEIPVSALTKYIQQATLKSSVTNKACIQSAAMKTMPSLRVTLERLPKKIMTKLLAQKKILCEPPEKRKVGRPRKIRNSLHKNDI